MRKIDLAYLAGFFDGEGCITLAPTQVNKKWQRTFILRVQLVSTNEWAIQAIKFSCGGVVAVDRQKGNHKLAYRWVISSNNALVFLKQILPYLKIKRPLAELAIKFQEHKTLGGRKTEEYIDFEEDYKKTFFQLNKRGKI